MENLYSQIAKIKKNIAKFYTCDYLYKGFEDLIKSLEAQENTPLSKIETEKVISLIDDFAADSRYNNYASANWMRYSARCFYCADYLTKYIGEQHEKENKEFFLNMYFLELVKYGVAPIIPQETLNKYIQKNVTSLNARELYNTLIRKAIDECSRCRYWQSGDAALACSYTQSINQLIKDYVKKYSDYTVLNEWLPSLNTVRLAKIWCEYPKSANYYHTEHYSRESIIKSLNKMLDIHLELFSYWYWLAPQEVINTIPQNDLIEILEVADNGEFAKILQHAVTLPVNEKVKGILEYFTHDDEKEIVALSHKLLNAYKK